METNADASSDRRRFQMERDTLSPRSISPSSRSRRTVATYQTYAEAQRAVDYLSDQNFPVQRVAIVAEGLRFVEQVTGRLGYGQAALNGALSGAVIGALFGFIFGLFDLITPLVSALNLALFGIIFGALIGAVIGLITYAFSGGQRDFTSTSGMQADRYLVMVDDEVAGEAEQLLTRMHQDEIVDSHDTRGS
jgi:hypothetical protein